MLSTRPFFSLSSSLFAPSIVIGGGGDFLTLLGHQVGLLSATSLIFHQRPPGSHTLSSQRNTVCVRSPSVFFVLRPGGRAYCVLPWSWKRHRRIEYCQSYQRSPRKTWRCLLRSSCFSIPRHVSFEFVTLAIHLTCAGWVGSGM